MARPEYYGCDFPGMNSELLTARFVSLLGEAGVRENEPMSAHTTFKTGGPADLMLLPRTEEGLVSVLRVLREEGTPYVVIGRGSNLLVSDEGIRGAVVKLAQGMDDIDVREGRIISQTGASLKALCLESIRAGLAGLEFAGGIPGALGGAVYMNAGAYGGEMKDHMTSVRVVDRALGIREIPAAEMDFSYRHSAAMEKGYIVLGAAFSLPAGDPQLSLDKMNEFNARRREKQPLAYPSAGSTFKRPKGNYAGTLIESCGLKGFSIGGAQVSEKHAGFIINTGSAFSRDIYELILHVKEVVLQETGVVLEPEVKMLGEF